MKTMIKTILFSMLLGFTVTVKPGPLTDGLKNLWNIPVSLISEEMTSLFLIVALGKLGYDNANYWLYNAEDRLSYLREVANRCVEYPRSSFITGLVLTVAILFNKNKEQQAAATRQKEKQQGHQVCNTCGGNKKKNNDRNDA